MVGGSDDQGERAVTSVKRELLYFLRISDRVLGLDMLWIELLLMFTTDGSM